VGLPIGLQIIGPGFTEPLILKVGAVLEDALNLTQRHPVLSI